MVVGIIYGEPKNLNSHYKRITKEYDYPVYIGQDFWHRLTGEQLFYTDLIHAIGKVACEANFSKELESVIEKLSISTDVIKLSK